jgi:hypothetical protein
VMQLNTTTYQFIDSVLDAEMVRRVGFEPTVPKRLIYSQVIYRMIVRLV